MPRRLKSKIFVIYKKSAKNTTNAANWKRDMSDEKRNMTVDECVAEERTECSKPYSNLIPFFCGSSELCRSRSDKALEIAKRNVYERYAIVGIMEDFPNTMKVRGLIKKNLTKKLIRFYEEK